MKIEVGMKLHVRADLHVGMSVMYDVNEEMEKLADEEVTVSGVCGSCIKIEEDEGKYSWSYNMFSEFVFWIKEILEKHKKWLNAEDGGERADLSGANLSDADLSDTKANERTAMYHLACPEEGAFIGFKKCNGAEECVLVKLEIPEDAKRSSATTRKCRCSKAKVISITGIVTRQEYNEAFSQHDKKFVYRVGETVVPDSFDEDRWNECSNGIHFFITKQEAIDY
nr:MAG TPA: hypothetical protein [Caudoviricetes sp.]